MSPRVSKNRTLDSPGNLERGRAGMYGGAPDTREIKIQEIILDISQYTIVSREIFVHNEARNKTIELLRVSITVFALLVKCLLVFCATTGKGDKGTI